MKHFNIDKVELVESTTGDDSVRFCYGDDDYLTPDFSYYNGITAVHDLMNKQNASRFKRAVFLQKLVTLAYEKSITCSYHSYNPNQFKNHGMVTIHGDHFMSFTLSLAVSKNAIMYKTTRFAHDEIADMMTSQQHAEGQLAVVKDYQELLDEVNLQLKDIGPKIDKLFK